MKKTYKFIPWVMIVAVFLGTFIGCAPKEPEQTLTTTSGIFPDSYPLDYIVDHCDLILHGTVLEQTAQYQKSNGGTTEITEYAIKIHKIFMGEYEEDIITVKTFNPLPFEAHRPAFYYEIGKECIVGLSLLDDTTYHSGKGYISADRTYSYFLPTETEGQFINPEGTILDLATLEQQLKELE